MLAKMRNRRYHVITDELSATVHQGASQPRIQRDLISPDVHLSHLVFNDPSGWSMRIPKKALPERREKSGLFDSSLTGKEQIA